MANKHRVALMGSGPIGAFVASELHESPDIELVGALVYTDEKDGKDVGELIGVGPIGVTATSDFEAFLKLDSQCVLHTVRDFGDFSSDDVVIRLLEEGKNVISPLPYAYLKARGEDVEARFKTAAEKGGATLHGAALNPSYLWERLGMALTGLCVDVDTMSLQEYFNMEKVTTEACTVVGFSLPKEEAEQNIGMAMWVENYAKQALGFVTDNLGIDVDRIERTSNFGVAPKKIVGETLTIEEGMVGLVSHGWTVYSNDKPVLHTEHNWYYGDVMRPAVADGNDFWRYKIGGRPELELTLKSTSHEETSAGFLMTAAPIIHSVAGVIEAPPGLLKLSMPQFHWKQR